MKMWQIIMLEKNLIIIEKNLSSELSGKKMFELKSETKFFQNQPVRAVWE